MGIRRILGTDVPVADVQIRKDVDRVKYVQLDAPWSRRSLLEFDTEVITKERHTLDVRVAPVEHEVPIQYLVMAVNATAQDAVGAVSETLRARGRVLSGEVMAELDRGVLCVSAESWPAVDGVTVLPKDTTL